MTFSEDFRWRAVALHEIYGISVQMISDLLGPKRRTITRWISLFRKMGNVDKASKRSQKSRWPQEVMEGVKQYVKDHPTFYLDELKDWIESRYSMVKNCSISTICRCLRFDLGLTRKVLTKAARECIPAEVQIYKDKMKAFYSYPEQILFIDETSKDGRHAFRRNAWSKKGEQAVIPLPFSRGKRVSVMAALDATGFIAYDSTPGTFNRQRFHDVFLEKVVPLLNPWPMPRSIVVMDNAKIHMYKELESVIEQCGAMLFFLPPYSPELNPIENAFGLLKKWIQRHANLVFPLYPEKVLSIAMKACTRQKNKFRDVYKHCGYGKHNLDEKMFQNLLKR